MIANVKKPSGNAPDAEALALTALAWIAGEPELLPRFLALSGLDGRQIAALARDRGFLGGVLDFLMGNEADLVRFAEAADLSPEAVEAAARSISGRALDSGEY